MKKEKINATEFAALLLQLKNRFEKNKSRHPQIEWEKIAVRLTACMDSKKEKEQSKLWSLYEMERTGGEPDVVNYDAQTGICIFYDCSAESPIGRRSLCYDQQALQSRKEFKPLTNAIDMAASIGVELLTEEQYRELQQLGHFDTKTSSWLQTPAEIRKLGGAIFGDYRYGKVFVYHNGAQSYYASRGFRASLTV